jgi:hypothetical protein
MDIQYLCGSAFTFHKPREVNPCEAENLSVNKEIPVFYETRKFVINLPVS